MKLMAGFSPWLGEAWPQTNRAIKRIKGRTKTKKDEILGVNLINILRSHFVRQYFGAKKITKPNVTREKLPNLLWYEKAHA